MGGRKNLECYRSLFAIEDEIGITNQYIWVLVVGEYLNMFLEELPGLHMIER